MRTGFTLSVVFHVLIVIATLLSLPSLTRRAPAGGSAIGVDLVMSTSDELAARTRTEITASDLIAQSIEESQVEPDQVATSEAEVAEPTELQPDVVEAPAPETPQLSEPLAVTDLPQTIQPQQTVNPEPDRVEEAVVIAALPPRLSEILTEKPPEPEEIKPVEAEELEVQEPEKLEAREPEQVKAEELEPEKIEETEPEKPEVTELEVEQPDVIEPEKLEAQEIEPQVAQAVEVPETPAVAFAPVLPRAKPAQVAAVEPTAEPKTEAPKKTTKKADTPKKKKFDPTRIGKAIGTGSSRSGTGGSLNRGEKGRLEAAISGCWKEDQNMPANIRSRLAVKVRVNFLQSGRLKGKPTVMNARPRGNKYTQAAVRSILTGLSRCDLSRLLPRDKFDTWKSMVVTFGKGGARL